MAENTPNNTTSDTQDALEKVVAKIVGENNNLQQQLKEKLAPIFENTIKNIKKALPSSALSAALLSIAALVPQNTTTPVVEKPPISDLASTPQTTPGGGEAGGEEAGGEEAGGEEAGGEEAGGEEAGGEGGDEKEEGEDGDEKEEGEDGDEKEEGEDGDEKEGEKEGKGAGGGKPGSPKVPGGELPEDQAEGAPKETGAGEKKQKEQAAALARDKQSGRRKDKQEEQQEEPKGTEKQSNKSKIKKKEKEIARKKNLIAALEFDKFTYAMFLACLLDISSLFAALLEIIPIIDILGAMIHYISLFLFGIPIVLILILLIKRIVTTKNTEIIEEVIKHIIIRWFVVLIIELLPIINGAPSVIWFIFKVKLFLFKIRHAQESDLKRLQKELQKLKQGRIRRFITGKATK